MASTENYNFTLIADGTTNWGHMTNSNMSLIDEAIYIIASGLSSSNTNIQNNTYKINDNYALIVTNTSNIDNILSKTNLVDISDMQKLAAITSTSDQINELDTIASNSNTLSDIANIFDTIVLNNDFNSGLKYIPYIQNLSSTDVERMATIIADTGTNKIMVSGGAGRLISESVYTISNGALGLSATQIPTSSATKNYIDAAVAVNGSVEPIVDTIVKRDAKANIKTIGIECIDKGSVPSNDLTYTSKSKRVLFNDAMTGQVITIIDGLAANTSIIPKSITIKSITKTGTTSTFNARYDQDATPLTFACVTSGSGEEITFGLTSFYTTKGSGNVILTVDTFDTAGTLDLEIVLFYDQLEGTLL